MSHDCDETWPPPQKFSARATASKGTQLRSTTRPFAQNLISRNFQHSKTLEKYENKEKLFELNGTLFVFS